MTQEFKSIDTILDEYAVRHDYRDWEQMYYDEGVEIGTLGIESVAKTYAKQFKEANKELSDMLIESKKLIGKLRRSMSVHPDCEAGSEFDDYTTDAQRLEDDIEELLNKQS